MINLNILWKIMFFKQLQHPHSFSSIARQFIPAFAIAYSPERIVNSAMSCLDSSEYIWASLFLIEEHLILQDRWGDAITAFCFYHNTHSHYSKGDILSQ
jgi:hypothetical protein